MSKQTKRAHKPSVPPTAFLTQCQSNGVSLNLKELMYYQAKINLLDLNKKHRIKRPAAGQYLAPHKGRGMEFAEVRHYQPGDDVRAIDWRVTARTGVAHTKLYQEEKERPIFILADMTNNMMFGSQLLLKSVLAAHLAALVAWAGAARGDRIGGLVFNEQQHRELKPKSRTNAVLQLLHQLVELQNQALAKPQSTNGVFLDNIKRLRQLAKPGSLVYLLSDFSQLNNTVIREIEQLSRHTELVCAVISDPFELNLSHYSQSLKIETAERTQFLALDDKNFVKRFSQESDIIQNQIRDSLSHAGAHILSLSAALPLEQQLLGGSDVK